MGARSCRYPAWVPAALLGCLAFAVACKTSLGARRDAGYSGDTGRTDLAADTPPEAARPDLALPDTAPDRAAEDLPLPDAPPDRPGDLPATDLASPSRVPRAFRIVNHTERTAYLRPDPPVYCRPASGVGGSCAFFPLACVFQCGSTPASGDCCMYCERPLPALLPIAPGETRQVPWNGTTHRRVTGACTACQCAEESAVGPGDAFVAYILVFAEYECESAPCEIGPDGIINMASPRGSAFEIAAKLTIPFAADEVLLEIGTLPETWPGFPEIPGHTFAIAADATPPDASARFGSACRPQDGGAHYDLDFSPDGKNVSIVRTDPVEEVILKGALKEQSDARLVYSIDNAFAGGELVVWRSDGMLIAQLSLFGSGVPVIWCVESPMTPA